MSESASHIRLVSSLVDWIERNNAVPGSTTILVDAPRSEQQSKPPRINGFVPDVYAADLADYHVLIGEAKTDYDLETRHSRDQLDAFVRWCSLQKTPALVLAVPWHRTRSASALLKLIKRKNDAERVCTIVIEMLGG